MVLPFCWVIIILIVFGNAQGFENVKSEQIEHVLKLLQRMQTQLLEKEGSWRSDPIPLMKLMMEEVCKMAKCTELVVELDNDDNELAMSRDLAISSELFKSKLTNYVEKVTVFFNTNGKETVEYLERAEKEQQIAIGTFHGTLAELVAKKEDDLTEMQPAAHLYQILVSMKEVIEEVVNQMDNGGKSNVEKAGTMDNGEEPTIGKTGDYQVISEANVKGGEANTKNKAKTYAKNAKKANANEVVQNKVRRSVRKTDNNGPILGEQVKASMTLESFEGKQHEKKSPKKKGAAKNLENGKFGNKTEAEEDLLLENVKKIIQNALAQHQVLMPSELLQLVFQLWQPRVLLDAIEQQQTKQPPAGAIDDDQGTATARRSGGHWRRKRSVFSSEIEDPRFRFALVYIVCLFVAFVALFLFSGLLSVITSLLEFSVIPILIDVHFILPFVGACILVNKAQGWNMYRQVIYTLNNFFNRIGQNYYL